MYDVGHARSVCEPLPIEKSNRKTAQSRYESIDLPYLRLVQAITAG
jgi:hypothetical protein